MIEALGFGAVPAAKKKLKIFGLCQDSEKKELDPNDGEGKENMKHKPAMLDWCNGPNGLKPDSLHNL